LYGVVHEPATASHRGLLVVTAGDALQYRAGTYRQFVDLARACSRSGIPVMRFDYRGIGDSEGVRPCLDHTREDIRAAIDAFVLHLPGLKEIVIWGMCSGASDAVLYAATDTRVAGIVLVNPWMVAGAGDLAHAHLKYFLRRLAHPADVWAKIKFDYLAKPELRTRFGARLREVFAAVFRKGAAPEPARNPEGQRLYGVQITYTTPNLADRMAEGLSNFEGPVLLIAGGDPASASFLTVAAASAEWRRLLSAKRVTRHHLAAADHEFSRREWRDRVASWTIDWLRENYSCAAG
jgi:exosortase A-associated hydrolase 1